MTDFDLPEKLSQLKDGVPTGIDSSSTDSHKPKLAPKDLVSRHLTALKREAIERYRAELLALQSGNYELMEGLRLEAAVLVKRAERLQQQQDLLDEVRFEVSINCA